MIDAFDFMINLESLNETDNYINLINTKNYYNFGIYTAKEFLEEKGMECFENTNEPGKHPNALGYNLISQEIYNYIVENNII